MDHFLLVVIIWGGPNKNWYLKVAAAYSSTCVPHFLGRVKLLLVCVSVLGEFRKHYSIDAFKSQQMRANCKVLFRGGVNDYETVSISRNCVHLLSSSLQKGRGLVSTCGAQYAHVSCITRLELKKKHTLLSTEFVGCVDLGGTFFACVWMIWIYCLQGLYA